VTILRQTYVNANLKKNLTTVLSVLEFLLENFQDLESPGKLSLVLESHGNLYAGSWKVRQTVSELTYNVSSAMLNCTLSL